MFSKFDDIADKLQIKFLYQTTPKFATKVPNFLYG